VVLRGGGGHIRRDDVRFPEKNPPAHRNKPHQTKSRSRCPKQQKNKPRIPNPGNTYSDSIPPVSAASLAGFLIPLLQEEKKSKKS